MNTFVGIHDAFALRSLPPAPGPPRTNTTRWDLLLEEEEDVASAVGSTIKCGGVEAG